jgi:hypothetical protein
LAHALSLKRLLRTTLSLVSENITYDNMNNKQGSHNGSASSHGNHWNKDKHHVPRDVTTIASPQPTLEPNLPAQQQAASTSEQFGLVLTTVFIR